MKLITQHRNIRALLYFLIFYIGFGGYLFLMQERLLYYPPSYTFESCPQLPDATLVKINGTRLFVGGESDQVLVIYQGNAGTVCDRSWYADTAKSVDWSYVLVSYSGYGDGTERPTHNRIRRDVENVIKYLEQEQFSDVRILGESIGGGVASYHTSLVAPNGLLLITPFDTLRNIARHHYWYYPTSLLVKEAYDNVTNLENFTGSVTIVHGTADSIIPIRRAEALYNSLSNADKQFIKVDGADHNNLWWYIDINTTIKDFLD